MARGGRWSVFYRETPCEYRVNTHGYKVRYLCKQTYEGCAATVKGGSCPLGYDAPILRKQEIISFRSSDVIREKSSADTSMRATEP